MKRNELIVLCMVFLLALGLRLYDISYPAFTWGDETGMVASAFNYWNTGQSEPDRWEHPPLRHILLYGFLHVLGDNPYGWRLMNVLFGSLAAILIYFFAFDVTGDRRVALMAGLLLATDPLHIVLSRYPAEEIYGAALFLAGVWIFIKHKGRSPLFIASAIFVGCALAIKWTHIPGWFLLSALALRENGNFRDVRSTVFVVCVYVCIPLSIYILSYYQWFGRGYSFADLIEFSVNAYYSLSGSMAETYGQGTVFLSHASAAEWFVRPIIVGDGTYLGPDRGEFILFMNSLPIWILTIPAMIAMAVAAAKKKSLVLAVPGLFFCATSALYLMIQRPVFIYSAAPLLPFVFTAIAYTVSRLAVGRYGSWMFYSVLAVMVAWNLYLFPLATAKRVDVASYRCVLDNAVISIH